jgi:hypothetical protein
MAWWAAAAGLALSALGLNQNLNRKQRAFARLETEENIRLRTLEQGQELGSAQVAAAVSNTQLVNESGYDKVLKDMQKEFAREIDWMKFSGRIKEKGLISQDTAARRERQINFAATAVKAAESWWG